MQCPPKPALTKGPDKAGPAKPLLKGLKPGMSYQGPGTSHRLISKSNLLFSVGLALSATAGVFRVNLLTVKNE